MTMRPGLKILAILSILIISLSTVILQPEQLFSVVTHQEHLSPQFPEPQTTSGHKLKNIAHWASMHADMVSQPGAVWNVDRTNSPAEAALLPLAGWLVEANSTLCTDAIRQLDYAYSRCDNNGFPLNNLNYIGRDFNARYILANYVAYKLLNNLTFLRRADATATAMLQNLSRAVHTFGGNSYNIFYEAYENAPSYTPRSPTLKIVPYQHAALGLSYTLLYHDSRSLLYNDSRAKTVAIDELNATFALQNIQTGEIARDENHPDEMDTANATVTIFYASWANCLWNNLGYTDRIRNATYWLTNWKKPTHISERFYPSHMLNEPETIEVWLRVAIYYLNGTDTSSYVEDCVYFAPKNWGFNTSCLHSPFCYFELLGLPSEIYLVDYEPAHPRPIIKKGETVQQDCRNGIRNSGFERDIYADWVVHNARLDTTRKYEGRRSLRIMENGIVDRNDYAYQSGILVKPSTQYFLSLRYLTPRSTVMNYAEVKLDAYDSTGSFISNIYQSTYSPSGCAWYRIQHAFVTPPHTATITLTIYNINGNAGDDLMIDQLQINEGTTFTGYQETFDYKWWFRRDTCYKTGVGWIEVYDAGEKRGAQYLYSTFNYSNFVMTWNYTRFAPASTGENACVIFNVDANDLTNRLEFNITPLSGDYSWHHYKLEVDGNRAQLYCDGKLISLTPHRSGTPVAVGKVGFLHTGRFHFGIGNVSIQALEKIVLRKGWNLISIPLVLENTTPFAVLNSVLDKVETVLWYDPRDTADPWKSYVPQRAQNMNDLSVLNHKIGFWISVSSDCILSVSGHTRDSTAIQLYKGWNLVGYPSLSNRTVAALFATQLNKTVVRVQAYNPQAEYRLQDLAPNAMMNYACGYWVYATEDCPWVVDW